MQRQIDARNVDELVQQSRELDVAGATHQSLSLPRRRTHKRPREALLGRSAQHAAAALDLPPAPTRTQLVATDLRHGRIVAPRPVGNGPHNDRLRPGLIAARRERLSTTNW